MAKNFTVPQVPGSKRSSKTRDYTHAVIYRFDDQRYAAELDKRLTEVRNSDVYRRDFEYDTRLATQAVLYPNNTEFARAVAILDERGHTFEAYVEFMCRKESDHTAKTLRENTGKWFVERGYWASSEPALPTPRR